MSGAEALHIVRDFFGADEAITNYAAGRDDWIATLIVTDKDMEAAWEKRDSVIADITKKYKLQPEAYRDSAPQDST
jgi:pyrrolysine biosynthesis protein PylC